MRSKAWTVTVFCVRHLTGKVLFVAAWLLLTRLFLPHILRVVDDALVELEDASETI